MSKNLLDLAFYDCENKNKDRREAKNKALIRENYKNIKDILAN